MRLTDSIIKAAKPRDRRYSLTDGKGLTLLVYPDGRKYWRIRYYFHGIEKMLSLGAYPETTLAKAREEHKRLREILAKGVDPSVHRKMEKYRASVAANNKFETVARAWWEHWRGNKTERHAFDTIRRLERNAFPVIGTTPVSELKPSFIIAMIKQIEGRGVANMARRVSTICGQVMRYAVAHELAERNPFSDFKVSDVLKPVAETNYARIDKAELPDFLKCLDNYHGNPLTRIAMQLMLLVFVRTRELTEAKWSEINLQDRLWKIPAERMKMRTPHIVPLSDQAIKIIEELKQYSLHSEFLFPGERTYKKPMSNNTILKALERMGYKGRMTGHGFRGLASTILHERGFDHNHIELQLAHSPEDEVSAAYNYATYLEPRRQMMQSWADYIDEIRAKNATETD